MKARGSGIYFDQQDRDILSLVNHILDSHCGTSEDCLFDPALHPHGIKELVASPVSRMAYAVVNLLRNLEVGGTAEDRLLALRTLHDEVLSSAHSALRRNTARVLMQIMKSMVRAHGNHLVQLKLAHDFRRTAQGTPRVVRRMLARWHLPEMPEEWNQIAFDDHVYDANTKGRKSPTHLIMDAWIKGLRSLTVVYEYSVDPEAANEILRAAEITGIAVRIGLEFQVPLHDRFAALLWIPRGFSSNRDFYEFLQSPGIQAMMERGRDVLRLRRELVLQCLHLWNCHQRPELEAAWGLEVSPLTDQAFMAFVGRGQPSSMHLAECLYRHVLPLVQTRIAKLAAQRTAGDESVSVELEFLDALGPDVIVDEWLSSIRHPEMPDFERPPAAESTFDGDLPELLRLTPYEMSRELLALNPGYRLVLCTSGLREEDVAELLWDCKGAITHLEIFNMKGWLEGRQQHIAAIGELQRALNQGLGPRVKQLVRRMLRRLEKEGDEVRVAKFHDMLRNVPQLWERYRHNPLKSRLGTSSASRMSFGMGLVLKETLPRRGVAALRRKPGHTRPIPVCSPVEESITYREPENPTTWQRLAVCLRGLPGCRHLGLEHRRVWLAAGENFRICPEGNVANLGGLNAPGSSLLGRKSVDLGRGRLGLTYLNSGVSNWLKVLLGFIPAFFSFLYTQDWMFLAWFGTFIWFGITGVRNVLQMVLAAQGATRSTMMHWKDHVSVGRICDSLMYTGISVLLLEVMIRVWFLQNTLDVNVADSPLLVFTVLNIVNGFYIYAHNIYRGFPKQAAVGNLFRSALAIPVSSLYNVMLYEGMIFFGMQDPAIYLVPSAAVVSKMASDTVAAIIEGYVDSQVNLRMRRWDYKGKLSAVFDCYTRLELLFPQEDALIKLARPGGLSDLGGEEGRRLERAFIINALDMMYFWFYQPRAQESLRRILRAMPEADRSVLARSQLVLTREREVSRLLVDGLLGRHFSRSLAFYLEKRKEYLRAVIQICRPVRMREAAIPAAVMFVSSEKKSVSNGNGNGTKPVK